MDGKNQQPHRTDVFFFFSQSEMAFEHNVPVTKYIVILF